jgi:TM2 domain-containing membrane protein YozV
MFISMEAEKAINESEASKAVIEEPKANVPAMPVVNVPAANVPAANVPAANVPAANVPAANVPAANVPAANVPAVNIVPSNESTVNQSANASTVNAPTNIKTNNQKVNNDSNGKKSEDKPYFYYTQRSFWGSPNANFTVLAALSIIPFTGLLGLDHFYLRSPLSGLLKAIGNLLTFGLWYFYDIAQVTGEADRVKNNGMSYPILGPTGLGAGIFLEKDEEAKGATPMTFLVYALLVLLPLPFALDHFFVGDTWGGFAKIFANFNIFLFIFGIFWALVAVFRLFFRTDSIFTEGVERVFPFTFFMDDYYCTGTKLGPKAECAAPDESQGILAFLKQLTGSLKGIPVIGQLVGLVDTTMNYVNNIIPPIVKAGTAAAALAPKVISEVAEKTGELANSDRYIKGMGSVQKGGGSAASAETQTHNTILLFVAFASVAAFGVFLAKIRNLDSIDVTNFVPRSFQSIVRQRFSSASGLSTGPDDVPPNTGSV